MRGYVGVMARGEERRSLSGSRIHDDPSLVLVYPIRAQEGP